MSNNKDPFTSSHFKEISSDRSNISEVKSEKHGPKEIEDYHISEQKDSI
jgi:hypothetical protein